jgi:phage replication-related protein YjqB (UPF0714/DUF867 family)
MRNGGWLRLSGWGRWLNLAKDTKQTEIVQPTSFAQAQERCTEKNRLEIEVRNHATSNVVIMAIHGGEIEPCTDLIANDLAGTDYNFYTFRGTGTDSFRKFHVPSGNFDEPACLELVGRCDLVVSVHGLIRDGEIIEVGGLDAMLGGRIIRALMAEGFEAIHATTPHCMGKSPSNICNRGRTGRGVQLEIQRGLRDRLKNDQPLRSRFTQAIQDALVEPQPA